MKIVTSLTDPNLVQTLRAGGIAVVRTDTLYGVVARADNKAAVERVYQLKDRTTHKACIVLIGDRSQLLSGVVVTPAIDAAMEAYWPGPVTLIMPAAGIEDYLTRGGTSLAFRQPNDDGLRQLLREVGPLIAPSANPEGEVPAMTIDQAVDYFGDAVDVYVDGGTVQSATPSRIISIDEHGTETVIR